MTQPIVWMNGSRGRRFEVDVLANGLHYGTGVFEGIRCYETPSGPAIFALDAHMERFEKGAEALGMALDVDALTSAVVETVAASGFSNAYIRPIAFYAEGGLALDTAPLTAHQAVAVMPWKSHLGEMTDQTGIRVQVSDYRRNSHKSLPPLKLCGGYVNSILAKRQASLAGFDEALFIDDHAMVCEATGENVFMVHGHEVTAVAHPDALPGITRATVMELSGASARPVSLDELLSADEVFLTGTSAEIVPVAQLGDRHFGPSPMTRQLQRAYAGLVRGHDDTYRAWLTAA